MAGINLLSDNLVDNSSLTITTGAANAQFPIDNLKNDATTRKFRSAGNTVVFEIDLGQTRTIDTVAVVGDTTGSLGITAMSIKTSVTNDFTLSTSIPISLSAEHNIGYEFITSVDHRYVEVTLTGTGSYAELSNIFVGSRVNIPQNSLSVDSFRYGNTDRSRFRANIYGQRFIDIRNQTKFISGSIEHCTKDEFETLDDIFKFHGEVKPIWVIIDPDNVAMNDSQYRLTMYSYFERLPTWSTSGGQLYTAQVRFEQVV